MAEVTIGPIDRFPEMRGVPVDVGGRRIAVFRVGNRVFAVDDFCPHRGFPLNDGSVDGSTVRCRTHGSCFDLESGEVRRGPASRGVSAHRARIIDGQVVIEVG
jgi:nitrite reductase/ring-hydroxylating ferredoxin subunit